MYGVYDVVELLSPYVLVLVGDWHPFVIEYGYSISAVETLQHHLSLQRRRALYPLIMKPDGLLRTFVGPATLALALQAWSTTTTTSTYLFASATLEQCHLDCAGNTTSELVAAAALNGGTWSVWNTQRLVGPTEPAPDLNATYPYARAPFPLPFHSFCQLGCSFFFAGSPQNTTCSGLCDDFYARNVSTGINDYAEKVT